MCRRISLIMFLKSIFVLYYDCTGVERRKLGLECVGIRRRFQSANPSSDDLEARHSSL